GGAAVGGPRSRAGVPGGRMRPTAKVSSWSLPGGRSRREAFVGPEHFESGPSERSSFGADDEGEHAGRAVSAGPVPPPRATAVHGGGLNECSAGGGAHHQVVQVAGDQDARLSG